MSEQPMHEARQSTSAVTSQRPLDPKWHCPKSPQGISLWAHPLSVSTHFPPTYPHCPSFTQLVLTSQSAVDVGTQSPASQTNAPSMHWRPPDALQRPWTDLSPHVSAKAYEVFAPTES